MFHWRASLPALGVRALGHVAVVRFDRGEILLKPGEILEFPASGQTRKHMINAEKELPLGEIHDERQNVVFPALELLMLALMEVVNSHVDFRAAGHPARQLLAQEKVGMIAKAFRPFDTIVIGEREKVHPPPVERRIYFIWVAIALTAEVFDKRGSARAGVVRVDVHIALHDYSCREWVLRADDTPAKILKMQGVIVLGT